MVDNLEQSWATVYKSTVRTEARKNLPKKKGSKVSVATFTKHAFQQSTHGQMKIIIRKQKKTQRTQDATERTPRRRSCEFD